MTHDWDLVERLLLEVRQSAHENFAPRAHAERLAEERSQAGQRVGDMDALKQKAADYEAILLEGGFIEPRRDAEGRRGSPAARGERQRSAARRALRPFRRRALKLRPRGDRRGL